MHERKRMIRKFRRPAGQRVRDMRRLHGLLARLKREFPGIGLAADQPSASATSPSTSARTASRFPHAKVLRIVERLRALGATVKISSIHINAWIGDFDKLSMMRQFLKDEFAVGDAAALKRCAYIGDSPNDEPMFAHFPLSVGVANVRAFARDMQVLPACVTRGEGGAGFVEFLNRVMRA
jgi:hypothetical protein